jgi:hypothetical protein
VSWRSDLCYVLWNSLKAVPGYHQRLRFSQYLSEVYEKRAPPHICPFRTAALAALVNHTWLCANLAITWHQTLSGMNAGPSRKVDQGYHQVFEKQHPALKLWAGAVLPYHSYCMQHACVEAYCMGHDCHWAHLVQHLIASMQSSWWYKIRALSLISAVACPPSSPP